VKGLARFRANIFMQRGAVAGAFRLVPFKIIPLEELGRAAGHHELCERPRGLVLVTGPTGSGKSTTLASMIDRINSTQHTTSSRSKTRSSTCTRTRTAW
jgi:twitching motility protein PilT